MNPQDHDHRDDEEFDAFLQGRGELAQLLQQMPQPTPPEALSAAIVAQAQAALRRESSANDAHVEGPKGAPIPSHFLRHARLPLALAASVVLAVIVGVQWQDRWSEPATVLIAQAPPSATVPGPAPVPTVAPTATLSKAPDASPSAAALGAAKKQVPSAEQAPMPPTVLAQADISQANRDAAVFRSVPSATRAEEQPAAAAAPAPAPAPALVAAAPAAPAAPVAASPASATPALDVEKAKAWLKLIDELIKADMRRDALDEWERFRKDYPHYPVPEKLSAQIKALKP